jgi:hypothetical protein
MSEVLYSPKHNEIFIFTGCFSYDDKKKTMTLYVFSGKKGYATIKAKDLVHIGWL